MMNDEKKGYWDVFNPAAKTEQPKNPTNPTNKVTSFSAGEDENIPRILDDELSKLGWNANARVAMLSNAGRENSWNAATIFGGHDDPYNKAANLGVISWQKERRDDLVNFLKANGGGLEANEQNLRLMARFLDHEMQFSKDRRVGNWRKINARMKDPNLSLDEAYPLLQQYILYRPEYEGANRQWEKRVRALNIAAAPPKSNSFWDVYQPTSSPNSAVASNTPENYWGSFQNQSVTPPAEPAPIATNLPVSDIPGVNVQVDERVASGQAFDAATIQNAPKLDQSFYDDTPQKLQKSLEDYKARTLAEMERTKVNSKRKVLRERLKSIDRQMQANANKLNTQDSPVEQELATFSPHEQPISLAENAEEVSKQSPAPLLLQTKSGLQLVESSNQQNLQPGEIRLRDTINDKGGNYIALKKGDDYDLRRENSSETIQNSTLRTDSQSENAPQFQTSVKSYGSFQPLEESSPKPSQSPDMNAAQMRNLSTFSNSRNAPEIREKNLTATTGVSKSSRVYRQKPTVEQVYRDSVLALYGDQAFAAEEEYRKLTGKTLFQPFDNKIVERDINENWNKKTGVYDNIGGQIAPGVQNLVMAFNEGGAEGLRRELDLQNSLAVADFKSSRERVAEERTRREKQSELTDPSFSKIVEDGLAEGIGAAVNPVGQLYKKYNELFGGGEKKIGEIIAKADRETEKIRREYGSFEEYEAAKKYAAEMSFMEASSRRFGGFIRGVVNTAVSSNLQGVDVVDSLIEKISEGNPIYRAIPDKFRPTLRNLENGIGYTIAALLGKGAQFESAKSNTNVDRRLFYTIGKSIEESLGNEKYLKETLGYKLSESMGSATGFLLLGMIAPEASIGQGLKTFSLTSGAFGALGQAGSMYSEAKGKGLSEQKAQIAGAWGLPLGALEGFGVGAALNKALKAEERKVLTKSIAEFFAEGGEELLQETAQGTGQDTVFEFLESRNPSLAGKVRETLANIPNATAKNMLDGGLTAFLSGGIFSKGVEVATTAARNSLENEQEREVLSFPPNSEIADAPPNSVNDDETPQTRKKESPAIELAPLAQLPKTPAKSAVEQVSITPAKNEENAQKNEEKAPTKSFANQRESLETVGQGTLEQTGDETDSGDINSTAPFQNVKRPVVQGIELTPRIATEAANEAATSPTNDLPEPTAAQIEAGNYKKGHINISGLQISVENPINSERKGVDRNGKAWSRKMRHHYGYIKRSVGADTENIDIFVKDKTPENFSGDVFIVDQVYPETNEFDEHKVMLGFDSEAEARAAYQSNYAKDWKGLKSITAMPMNEFKKWTNEKQSQPANKNLFTGDNAVKTDGAKTVNVNNQTVSLTPEQFARWEREIEPREKRSKEVFARRMKQARKLEAQGERTRAAVMREDANREAKADAMRLSAVKREIAGVLTEKEQAAKDKRESGNYIGKEVSLNGQNARVIGTPFGKVKVQFEDGTEKTADQVGEIFDEEFDKLFGEAQNLDKIGDEVSRNETIDEPTAADSLKTAAKDAKVGLDSALKGLAELFGDPNFKSSGFPAFDEKTYAKAKPHFQSAYESFASSVSNVREAVSTLIKTMNERGFSPETIKQMKPYFVRFIEETENNFLQSEENGSITKNDVDATSTQRDDRDGDGDLRAGDVSGTSSKRETDRSSGDASGDGNRNISRNDRQSAKRDSESTSSPARTDSSTDDSKPRSPRNSDSASDGISDRTESLGDNLTESADQEQSPQKTDYIAPVGSLARTGSWRETAKRNLDIIELVKKLEAEDRPASEEEQSQLAKFTGWGASEIANSMFPGVAYSGEIELDRAKDGWRDLAERAKNIFTPEELKTAARSTQYAHYTSEAIIRGIWDAFRQFGFSNGKILEPGMGVGLFAAAAPESVLKKSRYTGIEMDAMTARIAKQILPNQAVLENDFVNQKLPENFFDIAIGNPPFSSTKILRDPKYKKYRFMLHDYFFAKSIDSVRPGGLLVFVTSKGTMDKGETKMREYIAERADLLGAIRLPQTAFKENAGTEVVTDVIFLRKRLPGEIPAGETWIERSEITAKNKHNEDHKGFINEYFVNHPEMILGENSFQGSMYRANEYTVKPKDGDIEELFKAAIKKLPSGVFVQMEKSEETVKKVLEREWSPKEIKEGGIYINADGHIFRKEYGAGTDLASAAKISKADEKWLKSYIGLRGALKQAQSDQLKDSPDWEKSLKELNRVYDEFVAKHGQILEFSTFERTSVSDDGTEKTSVYKRFKNNRVLSHDVESPLVEALESITEDGQIVKSAMLRTRTIKPPQNPEIKELSDALAVSLDTVGELNLAHVTELIQPVRPGMTRDEVIRELGDAIFETANGEWQLADEYLSGFVVDKLEEAYALAKIDKRFERNVAALLKVQLAPLETVDISVSLGAAWIGAEVVSDFAREIVGIGYNSVKFEALTNTWTVEGAQGAGSPQ